MQADIKLLQPQAKNMTCAGEALPAGFGKLLLPPPYSFVYMHKDMCDHIICKAYVSFLVHYIQVEKPFL